jgi:hypothetical protein
MGMDGWPCCGGRTRSPSCLPLRPATISIWIALSRGWNRQPNFSTTAAPGLKPAARSGSTRGPPATHGSWDTRPGRRGPGRGRSGPVSGSARRSGVCAMNRPQASFGVGDLAGTPVQPCASTGHVAADHWLDLQLPLESPLTERGETGFLPRRLWDFAEADPWCPGKMPATPRQELHTRFRMAE